MDVKWRPIFGGAYEVSWAGDVRRVWGGRGATPGRYLRQNWVQGYRIVSISVAGRPRKCRVHRLVAEAFLGPCPPGREVNHRDGNRANNHGLNLEYVTPRENSQHASTIGHVRQGERHARAKLTEEAVLAIRSKALEGVRLSELSRAYGVRPSTVHALLHGRTWKQTLPGAEGLKKVRAPQAKLSEDQVREARRLFAEGVSQAELCRRFGLSPGTMHHLVHRITWKEVS